MNKENNYWEEIKSNWHGIEEELINSTEGHESLKNQIEANIRSTLIGGIIEILVGSLVSFYIVFELISGLPSIMDYVLYSGMFAIIVATFSISLWIRRRNTNIKSQNSLDFLKLIFKQNTMTIKLIGLSRISCIAIFMLCYTIIIWVFTMWLQTDHAFAKPYFAAVLVAFISLFFPALYYFLTKQKGVIAAKQAQIQRMIDSEL